jgi:hypothetical protein
VEKMMVLKLSRKCREIDRKYEDEFNANLDNGVYHRPANDSEDGKSDAEGDPGQEEVNQRLSSEEMDEFNEEIDFAEDLEATQKAFTNKLDNFISKFLLISFRHGEGQVNCRPGLPRKVCNSIDRDYGA